MNTTARNVALGVSATIVLIFAATQAGKHQGPEFPSDSRVILRWPDGGRPSGARCYNKTFLVTAEAGALLPDAGPGYYRMPLCAVPQDGGEITYPPGIIPVDGTESSVRDAVDGDEPMRAFKEGDPEAPFEHACGPGCEFVFDGGVKTWAEIGYNRMGPLTPWPVWRHNPDAGACVKVPGRLIAGNQDDPPECVR